MLKRLKKLDDFKDVNLNNTFMALVYGGQKDTTSGTKKITIVTGDQTEVCTYTTTDTYNECGELVSKCTAVACC